MYINKNFNFRGLMEFAGRHLIWLALWSGIAVFMYKYLHIKWVAIPLSSVAIVGTAVAFYIGFKNNQAYDRLWEARKIWGSIVNGSRAWGANLRAYVGNQFRKEALSEPEINDIVKTLVYRHIAWLYELRSELLAPTSWEHINQSVQIAKLTRRRIQNHGIGLLEGEYDENQLSIHLQAGEYDDLIKCTNIATQIIDRQSQQLKQLRAQDLIDDFRQIELQKILNDFFEQQGKAERIKKFPLPRQYGSASLLFLSIFIFLLPFGLVAEFDRLGAYGTWLAVPVITLIGWLFVMMELVGDYSENPFEGLPNDIPMLSLCRTIEIDLKEMIKDQDIPLPIKPKKGVLM
ncbi:bestrophin family protein [Pedobacter jeongneungensis]|uniref:bestrophin family protein n=1 Tax=Pedobacter jeongneungensis TaxID=947309 RepID=UPI000468FB69|nr:bestrophin family ion channel [Pedobacter jeongneungensis]